MEVMKRVSCVRDFCRSLTSITNSIKYKYILLHLISSLATFPQWSVLLDHDFTRVIVGTTIETV